MHEIKLIEASHGCYQLLFFVLLHYLKIFILFIAFIFLELLLSIHRDIFGDGDMIGEATYDMYDWLLKAYHTKEGAASVR